MIALIRKNAFDFLLVFQKELKVFIHKSPFCIKLYYQTVVKTHKQIETTYRQVDSRAVFELIHSFFVFLVIFVLVFIN